MKTFYIIMILCVLAMVVHSLFQGSFDINMVKFAVPLLLLYGYLLIRKKKT